LVTITITLTLDKEFNEEYKMYSVCA